MKYSVLIILSLFTFNTYSQIISQFNWNSGSPTTANVGPNATSISSSAYISSGGKGGTNGLNAGTPKMDINLTIPGSPTFDVQGIDLSIDYQREESQIDLVKRGSSLLLRISGGSLSVSYRVKDGAGSFITVSSGNIYTVPNDDVYRTYRFYYVPSTGVGHIIVDNVEQWSNDGVDNREMYWTPSDDVVIGALADGSGADKAFFDNFIVGSITTTPLPITLNHFKVEKQLNNVLIEWETASEINNDYFTIEKSSDAVNWTILTKITGAGNSNQVKNYNALDNSELFNSNYYRLKQTDYNGDYSYSDIEIVQQKSKKSSLTTYPNPTSDNVNIDSEEQITQIELYRLNGELIISEAPNTSSYYLNVSSYPRGTYFFKITTTLNTSIQKVVFN